MCVVMTIPSANFSFLLLRFLAGKVLFLVSGKISESDSSDSLLGGRKKDRERS